MRADVDEMRQGRQRVCVTRDINVENLSGMTYNLYECCPGNGSRITANFHSV